MAGVGGGWNLSIKDIAGNFPLPHGRGLVEECWVDVVPRVWAWRPAPAAMHIEPYGFLRGCQSGDWRFRG